MRDLWIIIMSIDSDKMNLKDQHHFLFFFVSCVEFSSAFYNPGTQQHLYRTEQYLSGNL